MLSLALLCYINVSVKVDGEYIMLELFAILDYCCQCYCLIVIANNVTSREQITIICS